MNPEDEQRLLTWQTVQAGLPTQERYGQNLLPSADLLIGNGFSIRHGMNCDYPTLYDAAGFAPRIQAHFRQADGFNYEAAMDRASPLLADKAIIAAGDEHPDYEAAQRRVVEAHADVDTIRNNLRDDLLAKHPRYHGQPLPETEAFLDHFRCIFTTNFDLLIYWMSARARIRDYFKAGPDDAYAIFSDPRSESSRDEWRTGQLERLRDAHRPPGRVAGRRQWPPARAMLWLHGAYLLRRASRNNVPETRKLLMRNHLLQKSRANLVEACQQDRNPVVQIIGRDADAKTALISASDYLKFCHEVLEDTNRAIVTFGFSFDTYDQHILTRIRDSNCTQLYVGLYGGFEQNAALLARVRQLQVAREELERGPRSALNVAYWATESVALSAIP